MMMSGNCSLSGWCKAMDENITYVNRATADMTKLLSGIQDTEVTPDCIIDAVEELNNSASQLIS